MAQFVCSVEFCNLSIAMRLLKVGPIHHRDDGIQLFSNKITMKTTKNVYSCNDYCWQNDRLAIYFSIIKLAPTKCYIFTCIAKRLLIDDEQQIPNAKTCRVFLPSACSFISVFRDRAHSHRLFFFLSDDHYNHHNNSEPIRLHNIDFQSFSLINVRLTESDFLIIREYRWHFLFLLC